MSTTAAYMRRWRAEHREASRAYNRRWMADFRARLRGSALNDEAPLTKAAIITGDARLEAVEKAVAKLPRLFTDEQRERLRLIEAALRELR